MADFSTEKLLMLNQIGLIPGPKEESEAFLKRVDYSFKLKENLPEELKENLSEEFLNPELLVLGSTRLKKLYDSVPSWPPLFYSNFKLPFWQGGCAWIFQMTEDSPTSALIQLRKNFKKSSKYLGLYDREELIAHELSHIGRLMFQEPKYEEFLAYRTASAYYRRWIGPLVQSSMESALFLLFLFILIVFDVFLLALGRPDAYFMALWLKIIPVAVIFAGVARLYLRHNTYARCIKNLTSCVKEEKEEAVAYRLQDSEIVLFSRLSPKEIQDYAISKSKEELRWQVIYEAYFI